MCGVPLDEVGDVVGDRMPLRMRELAYASAISVFPDCRSPMMCKRLR
jgi:hypothetical protein